MKQYNYGDRIDLCSDALDRWIGTFTNKTDRRTAYFMAYLSGHYFDYSAPISAYQGRFSSKVKTLKMKAAIKRIANAYKIPALSICKEDGTPPARYNKKYSMPV